MKDSKSYNIKPDIKFLKQTATQAGKILHSMYGRAKIKYTKENPGDIVTEADIASNKFITESIKKKFPEHYILSEEGNVKMQENDHVWIIDPLDGTRNYSTHTPLYGVMIAYVYRQQVEMCAIYLPESRELFYAENGKGAYCNSQKIRCSKTSQALYSYGALSVRSGTEQKKILDANITKMTGGKDDLWISGFGSAAVNGSYVAAGQRDWYIAWNMSVWDVASIALLMKESGCKITDFSGKGFTLQSKSIIACNPLIYNEIFKLCKGM